MSRDGFSEASLIMAPTPATASGCLERDLLLSGSFRKHRGAWRVGLGGTSVSTPALIPVSLLSSY